MQWPNSIKSFCFLLVMLICFEHSNNAPLDIQDKYEKFLGDQGLYGEKDDVEILTAKNFKDAIINSKRAWVVEFYNSWCGFCQRFAPSWKEFASDVRGWRDLVVVAAMDCAVEDNYPLCRDYEVMGYPAVRYYQEGFKEMPKSYGVAMNRGATATDHRQDLISKMVNEQREGRGRHFPDLMPYSGTDTNDLFNGVLPNVTYAVLVLQEPGSTLGPEITVDLHKTSNLVTRYSLSNNTNLVTSLGAKTFPTIFVIAKDHTYQELRAATNDRHGFLMAANEYLKQKHINLQIEQASKGEAEEIGRQKDMDALIQRVKSMGDVVFQMDLETALRYSLKREVGSYKEISGEKLNALRKYLEVLSKYFPFGRNGKILLEEISTYAHSSSTIEGLHIAKLIIKAEKEDRQVFSTPKKWLGCHGSLPKYRGYPCGLWKMFHYLTVNIADYNIGSRGNNPRLALEAMHGYIKHFFSCADCSQHFQEMAARREIDKVSSFDDAILWLWSAHNEVNKRLSSDPTEDPDYPKVQFPSSKNCPSCHKVDGSWDLTEVMKYLKHMYSSINVRYLGADTKIIHMGLDGDTASTHEGLPKKDVQIQTRPFGEGVANGTTEDISSRATTKDKASLIFPLYVVLTILYVTSF